MVSDSSPRTTMDAYRFNIRAAQQQQQFAHARQEAQRRWVQRHEAHCHLLARRMEFVRDSFREQQMYAYQSTSLYDARTSRTGASSSSPPSSTKAICV
ncbi:hypothetical protein EXIGLDRAFT_383014 [Exidia glandulosa HHB12029]|uniref:Uncharacterized protein n=1 Tax=Exidia glandulosa HHB12029 TaxID=1314781 RepID=A0A165L2A4_EXIGL|nr:hypothetical protein EXIGLDRAFT_383014 [Exidia glandulosa HHB12029]